MSKFKRGDIVRYTSFVSGIGIYLGYDKEADSHVIGCFKKHEETRLEWVLYVDDAADLELLERPNIQLFDSQTVKSVVGLNELNAPSRPVQRLEDLIDEL